MAFLAETGDGLGVIWRPGNANTAAGAIPWIQALVGRLRAAGVEEITLRLDKGFFSREMVEARSWSSGSRSWASSRWEGRR